MPSKTPLNTPPKPLRASDRRRESRLTKVKAGMNRLTTSIMACIVRLICSTKVRTADTFSPSTSMVSPTHTARKMICRELPSRKGVTMSPGMMSSSMV